MAEAGLYKVWPEGEQSRVESTRGVKQTPPARQQLGFPQGATRLIIT